MPQAIVDPGELRRFASDMKHFDGEVSNMMQRLWAQFQSLGDTWRDQEHVRFAQEFQQTMRMLDRFIREAEEHIPFLLRKAQAAEEYLRRR